MRKGVISVIGIDRPGIVAAISMILLENRCNIEEVSQTILQAAFAGIFVVSIPGDLAPTDLLRRLQARGAPLGLDILLRPLDDRGARGPGGAAAMPFVVTTTGPDRMGLVAGITGVMARFGVNITNLKAVFRGGDDPARNTMIYEVDVPADIDHHAFREALRERALELGLDLSLQHREIFEAIHRV